MSEPARPGRSSPPGMARPPLPAAALLAAALLHCAPAAPARRHKPDMSRKHHTWKEQSPWLSSLVGTGVAAKGFPMGADEQAAGWNPPRCGVPDLPVLPDGQNGRNRQKRFVLSGGRWDKTDLTYKIIRFPWQLVKTKVRRTIEEALKVWSDVTPLTFTEVQEGRADIVIDFTRYWHGDNLPFDGPGGILAHAFFPKTHREGDVHFDYDETWTIGNNLDSQYWIYDGERRVSGPTPTVELGLPASPVQAALVWGAEKNKIYIFSGGNYWRFNPRTRQVDNIYPRTMADWRGVPQEIDAAFQDELGFAYFLRGRDYWKFDPVQVKVLEGYPRQISQDFFSCTPSSNSFR